MSPENFIRTTESRHIAGVKKLWESLDYGDLFSRYYRGLYCEGCEDFVVERDLAGGKCPDHLTLPKNVEETNYFFRLSKYQNQIERLIDSDEIRILPEYRKREVLAFVRSGLRDISVSRDANRMSGWGIPVPDDPTQVIYVWIDALINYISGIGFGTGLDWRKNWNEMTWKLHVIGKNVWKFHAVYWPALLLSAGLPVPNTILIHGFLTVEGRKISKSLGNAIDPVCEVGVLGSDALRLYLLSLSTFADGDYSREGLFRFYNKQIAVRLGSTVTRITALCERLGIDNVTFDGRPAAPQSFLDQIDQFRLDGALNELMKLLDGVNEKVAEARPWESDTHDTEMRRSLERWTRTLQTVGYWIQAFAPGVGKRILEVVTQKPIRKPASLFPRTQ